MTNELHSRRIEFARALTQEVNNSNLPPCVVLDVLQFATAQVSRLAEQQLRADRNLWQSNKEKQQ